MGCDIHIYTERRVNGVWQSCDEWASEDNPQLRRSVYDSRCYDLFSILADVRNGRGFAGVVTGDGFIPISAPRGLPPDVSAEVRRISDYWSVDGHSHSWFTLKELLDYDWTQTTSKQGWTTLASWTRWWRRDDDGPNEYCGGVGGFGIKKITADEMESLVRRWQTLPHDSRDALLREHSATYALAKWQTTYAISAGTAWWTRTIPALLKLAGGAENVADVRVVFFFDN